MWKEKLKKQFEENPLMTIAIGTLAITATAKLIDALSVAQGRRAYAKQIEHKIKFPKG
jgi:hypothetical protein